MKDVTVSALMPTFNDCRTIADAIESAQSQTLEDWELLVVDDASTDTTADIVREFAGRDDRIKLLTLAVNSGSGVARNRALELAVGEFVAVMDADDVSLPTRFAQQVEELRSDSELAVVASQVAEFGDWGGPVEGEWATSDDTIADRQVRLRMPVPHPSCMFRTSVLRSVGGYDEACRRAQDFALFLKLRDRKVRCLDSVHVNYRTARPVKYNYVRKNSRYTDLAIRRYEMELLGAARDSLPTDPTTGLRVELSAIKSYLIRSLRERISSI